MNKTLVNQTYSLAEVRNGTGWPKGARFALITEVQSQWHLFCVTDGEHSWLMSGRSESKLAAKELVLACANDEHNADWGHLDATFLGIVDRDICELL